MICLSFCPKTCLFFRGKFANIASLDVYHWINIAFSIVVRFGLIVTANLSWVRYWPNNVVYFLFSIALSWDIGSLLQIVIHGNCNKQMCFSSVWWAGIYNAGQKKSNSDPWIFCEVPGKGRSTLNVVDYCQEYVGLCSKLSPSLRGDTKNSYFRVAFLLTSIVLSDR